MTPLAPTEIPSGLILPPQVFAVRVTGRMELPQGVELSTGVEVVSSPVGMYLPSNVVLLRVKPGTQLPPGVETVPYRLPPGSPPLPEGTIMASIPPDIRVHSWGWKLAVISLIVVSLLSIHTNFSGIRWEWPLSVPSTSSCPTVRS